MDIGIRFANEFNRVLTLLPVCVLTILIGTAVALCWSAWSTARAVYLPTHGKRRFRGESSDRSRFPTASWVLIDDRNETVRMVVERAEDVSRSLTDCQPAVDIHDIDRISPPAAPYTSTCRGAIGDRLLSGRARRAFPRRRGAYLVICVPLLTVAVAVAALAIDVSRVIHTRVELQSAVDAACLAGAGRLDAGKSQALTEVADLLAHNPVAGQRVATSAYHVEVGQWDRKTRVFTASETLPSAIRLTATSPDVPYVLARLLGHQDYRTECEAVATYQPRDILLVLDYSASMSYDSQLRQAGTLGASAVVANLQQIYTEIGSPRFGSMTWAPLYLATTNPAEIASALGLTNVPYPYPGGSWSEYFSYVQTDGDLARTGYRKAYGYLTLVNYWLSRQPAHNETPDLWKTSEQPLTAMKSAVTVFLGFLREGKMDDRVGIIVYTAADGTAQVLQPLTTDLERVDQLSRGRQAGHDNRYTNIGDGVRFAREEMLRTARPGAYKLMVVLTDGQANRPSGVDPRTYAAEQARLCGESGIPILSISLGAEADQALLQQFADQTAGHHFAIPGGQSVSQYEASLVEVFRRIALHRPLKLVR